MRLTRAQLAADEGFSLVELIVAMTVGLLILFSAFTIITTSARSAARVTDRVEATQQVRRGVSEAVRTLRGATCTSTGVGPIISADARQVTFIADFDDDNGFSPQQWQIATRRTGTDARGVAINSLAVGSPTATRTLVDGLVDVRTGQPTLDVLSYHVRDVSGNVSEVSGPLSADQRRAVAGADIELAVGVRRGKLTPSEAARAASPSMVRMQSSAFPRTFATDDLTPVFSC